MKRYGLMAVSVWVGIVFFNIPSIHAETISDYLQNGNDAYKQGDYDQAIFDYTKVLDINPNLAKAYDNRGVAYAQRGFLPAAIADFTMAIANNPKDAEAYNNRGHAYDQQGNLTQAIADYSQAIEINILYLKAYKNREFGFYKLGEYDKAWADVFKIEELGGTVDHDFYQALKKASGKNQ